MVADPSALSPVQSARRDRVVQVAIDLARDGGYDAVQMRAVATEARVALGTIYRYFASKDHLLAAGMERWVSDLRDRVTRRPPQGDSVAERVIAVLGQATRAMERQPRLSNAVVRSMMAPGPEAAACVDAVSLAMDDILRTALGDAVDPDTAVRTARTLGYVWMAALIGWVNGWTGIERVADELDVAAHLLLDHLDP